MSIKIIGAAYGAKEGSFDVTGLVQQHVNNKGDELKVTNQDLGDPAPGHTKHFGVVYEIEGNRNSLACEEGQTVLFR